MAIRCQLTALRPVGSTQPLGDDVLVGGRTRTPLPMQWRRLPDLNLFCTSPMLIGLREGQGRGQH